MDTGITPDPRIRAYEKLCRIKDGKGHAVSIDPGTRVYREKGDTRTLRAWLREVQSTFGGELVPFEWVPDYVGITRAALHKRVRAGKLTVLVYEMRERVKGVLGGERERMRREYRYVPLSECRQWMDLLTGDTERDA